MMKKSLISFLRAAIFLGFIFLIAGCSHSNPTAGGPTPTPGNAFVYVTLPGENRIAGFANDTTGALTRISGSPFDMPGQPFGIAASPNNRFLYVTLIQTSQISEFFVNPANGTLTPVPCPIPTTGLQPFTIAISPAGTLLYTLNEEGSVSGFSINATTGCLTAISTASTTFGPVRITIDQSGQFLYVVTIGGITLYTINPDGTLTRQAVGGFDAPTNTMLAVKAVPTFELLMATDGGSTNNIRTFTINTNNGTLTPIVATPPGSSPTNPTAIAFNTPLNATTPLFYIASFISNNFTVNTVDATGAIGTTSLTVPLAGGAAGSSGPVGLAVDPSGRFLYVASSGSDTVSVFNANITAANVTTALISTANTPGVPAAIVVVGHP
jgi:6-phosphogluconolactonase (cycloisomerase 2 family)